MTRLTEKGISTTRNTGEEKYERFSFRDRPREFFYQYDYRHADGELFSCVKPSLKECREAREEWIKNNKAMNEKKKTRPEIEDVKLENLIREVCNRLTNFTPATETTEFFISEVLRLEDKCKEVKCKLTDI